MEDQPVSDPDRGADRPATFREVLANGEFRAIFFAGTLSTVGDSMARAAVTALVFKTTGSVFASGATFAISYLPWIGIGSVLAAVAERYSYRRTMIVCDLARMLTIGLVAVPHAPVPVLWGLLFLTALFDPPFRAARSALNARVLTGDRYVLGLSMTETAVQLSLILGYFLGGTVAAYSPRSAVLFDAATFGLSAGIVALWVRPREAALSPERRTHLLRETGEGFSVVFGRPVLRSIAIVVFAGLLFAVVPEGLGAGWAGWLTKGHDGRNAGWIQGLIMCSMPTGFILGSILINRFIPAQIRQRLTRPFAVLAPLALVFAVLNPNVWGVAVLAAVSGFAVAAMLPAANGLFVQSLPNQYRARAFGVMQSGVQLVQGAAVFATGALASRFHLPVVVGLWGAGGVILMLLASLSWPRHDTIEAEIERARQINETTEPNESKGTDRPGRHALPGEDTRPLWPLHGGPPDDGRPGRHRLRAASH
jgi:predicted MFS family arabinose efflux permease